MRPLRMSKSKSCAAARAGRRRRRPSFIKGYGSGMGWGRELGMSTIASPASVDSGRPIMPTRNVDLLEQREREDQARLECLRAAVKKGIDDIERGDYVTLRSDRDIGDFVRQLRKEAAESAADDTRG